MPLMRVPGARIAIVGASNAGWEALTECLAHELTTVVRHASVAELLNRERPDIVVLDRSMTQDGGVGLRRVRQRWPTCLIIVTRATDEHDAEQLMDIGADEAIIAHQLLTPRLRAASRRARTINAGMRIAIGDIVFDRESRRVWCAGHEVRLTRTEEALLDCMFWYAPRAATITELTAFAWGGSGETVRHSLLHVYIGYLRKKLGNSRQVTIRTIRGTGYEFAARRPV